MRDRANKVLLLVLETMELEGERRSGERERPREVVAVVVAAVPLWDSSP